jgi:dGTPase
MEIEDKIKSKVATVYTSWDEQYAQHATKNSAFLRRKNKKPDELIRPPFFRDADRIIHSKAYSRYIDKTQVFFLIDNDHITHRVLHVQLVSKIARTIGRALGLNEDLIEAISLGHDIGHTPYGHLGEKCLNKQCKENEIGYFKHNVQSIQFLDTIEDLDLTIQVLDGILCHNGEVTDNELKPQGDLNWNSFNSKLHQIKQIKRGEDHIFPLTYEGCVVRFADNIAYLGRDLQDAIELKLLNEENELKRFPHICCELFNITDWKKLNWSIIDTLIKDLVNNSYEQDKISFSKEIAKSVQELKNFNYDEIYLNKKLHEEDEKIEFMFNAIFEYFLYDLRSKETQSLIYKHMLDLDWVDEGYKENVKDAELVRDFIAGMTDRYFDSVFYDIMVPIRRRDFE